MYELDLSYSQAVLVLSIVCLLCGKLCDTIILPKHDIRKTASVDAKPIPFVFAWSFPVRVLTAMAIIAIFHLVPFVFSNSRPVGKLSISAILLWWGTFKVIAALLGRGPLMVSSGWVETTLLLSLPVARKQEFASKHNRRHHTRDREELVAVKWLVLYGVFKMALFATLVYIDRFTTTRLPHISHHVQTRVIYSLMVYLSASLIMDFPAVFVRSISGIQLTQHFNAPYLSCSFQEFWGQRWNLTAGSLLRASVYEPVMEVLSGLPLVRTHDALTLQPTKNPLVRIFAMSCAFVVSGIAHETLLWFSDSGGTWLWFWFFAVQPIFIVGEHVLFGSWLSSLKERSLIVRVLANFCFVAMQLMIAEVFFWPPVERSGLADRLLSEFGRMFK